MASVALLGTLATKGAEYEFPRERVRESGCDVIFGVGGPGGASIVSAAMRALPVGVPKLIVSTMGSGDTFNDPVFARAMAGRLDELHRSWSASKGVSLGGSA